VDGKLERSGKTWKRSADRSSTGNSVGRERPPDRRRGTVQAQPPFGKARKLEVSALKSILTDFGCFQEQLLPIAVQRHMLLRAA
jgi:hypothetical protein